MPPFSKAIWEEGAAIKAFKLVENGVFQASRLSSFGWNGSYRKRGAHYVLWFIYQEDGIVQILKMEMHDDEGDNTGEAIPGTRRIDDNLSDLRAQVFITTNRET